MTTAITERDLAELAEANGNMLAFELHSSRIYDEETAPEIERLDQVADVLRNLVAGKPSKATRALADEIAAIIGLDL